jgi:hypothetical protein
MNIKIEKRTLELNRDEFVAELKEHAKLIQKHSPSTFGITIKWFNIEFGLKLKSSDYYKLADELGIKLKRGIMHLEDILKLKDKAFGIDMNITSDDDTIVVTDKKDGSIIFSGCLNVFEEKFFTITNHEEIVDYCFDNGYSLEIEDVVLLK